MCENSNRKTALLDASSAILLSKAGLHETLADLYTLVLPQSVFHKITGNPHVSAAEFEKLLFERKIGVVQERGMVFTQEKLPKLSKLDPGERDSLFLYLSGMGDFLITDDGPAAKLCQEQKIPFINALLVPKILAMSGREDAAVCEQAFQTIENLGRYSKKVISLSKSLSKKDLEFFIQPMETRT